MLARWPAPDGPSLQWSGGALDLAGSAQPWPAKRLLLDGKGFVDIGVPSPEPLLVPPGGRLVVGFELFDVATALPWLAKRAASAA